MNDDDALLPAPVAQTLTLHPALVEQVQDDPEALAKMTRAQLAVVQDRMVKKVLGDSTASITQLATVHERLAKGANLSPAGPGIGGASGTQVTINFIRGPGKEKVVIDAQATPVAQTTDVTPA